MTFLFERPPDRLTWYHLGPLLDAEAGGLRYDTERYRVHGVPNAAVACRWAGLLADDRDGGLALTDLGRSMLTDWQTSPEGQAWLAEWSAPDEPADNQKSPPPPGGEQRALIPTAKETPR